MTTQITVDHWSDKNVGGCCQALTMKSYLINCDTCQAKPSACEDCLITAIVDQLGTPITFSEQEKDALAVMAEVGLIPPLRLVAG